MLDHGLLLNLLYPPACLLCHTRLPVPPAHAGAPTPRPALFCDACVSAMPRNGAPVCTRCGLELPGAFDAIVQCAACRSSPPAFEMARSLWRYEGPMQQAIQQFKYHRRWRIGQWLAQEMARFAQATLPLEEVAVILPVPMHWLKQRVKGYNPAEHLALTVARSLQKPAMPGALRRVRWTATQTRLRWHERFRNVRQAFLARERAVRDRTVLLIDDVLTSGATASACALACQAAGARCVLVLTAARTPLP